jgi:uncharacterized repeat protein (TIGR01451 family)
VSSTATGNLVVAASVAPPAGTGDPVLTNNSATDTDAIVIPVDLAITVTDNQTLISRGAPVRYTIVVTNNGPNAVTGARVRDNFPNILNTINWTCVGTGGASCGGPANDNGTINRLVNLPVGSFITFTTASGRLPTDTPAFTTTLTNTATVTAPTGYLDTNTANNSATDIDTINGVHVGDLDWTSANTTGNNGASQWSATVTVTVHDASHNPVTNAAVSGSWVTFSGTGSANCTTNASGQCTVTRSGLNRANLATVTFAVLNLSHAPDGYQITLNHDPDAGTQASNGTTITVSRP